MKNRLIPVFIFFTLLVATFFYKSVIYGHIPMPADHALGAYYPWLDYKWPGFPAGVPVKNPMLADVPSLFYPLKIYSTGLFKSGIFPTWNPLIFGGYPLLATFQSGVLNPFNFFFLIFSSTTAWTLFIAAQVLLALTFTYFFLRDLAISRLPAIFGSIVFAFCGFNLIWLEYGIHGYVAAFIPLMFLLTRRLVVNPRPQTGFYLSVIVAGQLFFGYPQLTLFSLIFLTIWVIIQTGKVRSLVSPIVFWILGLLLAAILLFPGAELFINSQRPGEPVAGGSSGAYLKYSQLITLLAPDYFGHPSTYNSWGSFLYTNNTGYASLVALLLASLSIRNFKKRSLFFLGLYVVPIFLSLPHPITEFIQTLPLFSASVATRVMIFSGFALSYLGALGLQRLLNSTPKFRDFIFPGCVVLLLTTLFLITKNPVGVRNLILPLGLTLSVSAVLVAIRWFPYKRRFLTLPLLFLLVFELFRFGWKYNVFFPSSLVFPTTPLITHLKNSPPGYRLDGGDVLPLSLWMAYGLKSASGYDAVYPQLWAKYLSAIDNGNLDYPKGRLGDLITYNSPLLDIAGVKYLLAVKRDISGKPDPQGVPYPKFVNSRFQPDIAIGSVQVYDNPNAIPQFSVKGDYEVIVDDKKALNRLLSDDFDYHQKLILSSSPGYSTVSPPSAFQLEVVNNTSTYQAVQTRSDSPIFLLNAQVYYPGWTAAIDGKSASIIRADLAFQSVLVPAGNHLIEFTYRPLSLTIGICVSLISLTLIAIYSRRLTPKRSSGLV